MEATSVGAMNGQDKDWDNITRYLAKIGEPLTRESYLDLAFLGEPPSEVDEDSLPPSIRAVAG